MKWEEQQHIYDKPLDLYSGDWLVGRRPVLRIQKGWVFVGEREELRWSSAGETPSWIIESGSTPRKFQKTSYKKPHGRPSKALLCEGVKIADNHYYPLSTLLGQKGYPLGLTDRLSQVTR